MQVYEIIPDVDRYQYLVPDDDDAWDEILVFDGTSKIDTWEPPKVRIYNPRAIKGDFYDLSCGGFVLTPHATEILRTECEIAGELLPIYVNNEEHFLLNILECINCLDHDKTKWIYGKTTGKPIEIEKYVFMENMFSEASIFKIPETCRGECLVVTGRKNEEDEFKHIIESNNLKGLDFKLLWEKEIGDIPHK